MEKVAPCSRPCGREIKRQIKRQIYSKRMTLKDII
jgi:hypothetical protein